MNDEMTKEDINEAEIQMIEDPELDARMNAIEKENQIETGKQISDGLTDKDWNALKEKESK